MMPPLPPWQQHKEMLDKGKYVVSTDTLSEAGSGSRLTNFTHNGRISSTFDNFNPKSGLEDIKGDSDKQLHKKKV